MDTASKGYDWGPSGLRFMALMAIAVGLGITTAPTAVQAQSFKVATFQCTPDDLGIQVDVRGLGNTNVCVEGAAPFDAFCACQTKSGHCPNAANKRTTSAAVQTSQVLQPKNGRVRTTTNLVLPGENADPLCSGLSCPKGQRAALVGFETTGDATFRLCTTTAQPGQPCSCDAPNSTLLVTQACLAAGEEQAFTDVGQDCVALFPQLSQ